MSDKISRFKALIHKSRTDPIYFAREIVNLKNNADDLKRLQNWELDEWQIEGLEAVADCFRQIKDLPTKYNHDGLRKLTVRAMHGPGKTFWVALVMHWFNFCFRGLIVCTAPKERQLKTRLWPTFRKIRSRAGETYSKLIQVDATQITWCGDPDWTAQAETASTPENIAGYHAEYMLFIIDEASGIKEEMFPAIEGALSTGTLVILIMIGNPTKNIGTFHDSHKKPSVAKNYYRMHVDLEKTTRVDREWIKQMLDKYGESSPVFQVRCLGNFGSEDQNQLISLDWLERQRDVPDDDNGELFHLRYIIDVSDGGMDETIFKVAKIYPETGRRHFLKMWRKSYPTSIAVSLGLDDLCRMVDEFGYDERRGDDVVIDSLGVGAGFAAGAIQGHAHPDTGRLIRFTTIAYKGGEASDDQKQWRNRRVQSYMVFRNGLRDGLISYDENFCDETDWEEFCAQACSIRLNPSNAEKVEDLETKSAHKARVLKSPDMADCGAMSCADVAPVVAVETDAFYISQSRYNYHDGSLIDG